MREISSPLDGIRSPFGFIRGGGVVPFSPSTLFASGEEGAWYEPSTTTAFLSTTDLTPCGYGDGCGFLLDKSKGAGYSGGSFTGLGSDLLEDPSFDDASKWLVTGGWSVSSGQASIPAGFSASTVYQSNTIQEGVLYLVEIVVASGSSSIALRIRLNETSSYTTPVIGPGTHRYLVSGVAGPGYVGVTNNTNIVGSTFILDSLSVREIPGNHATQVTAGARPILARVPEGGRRNLLTYSEEMDPGNTDWDVDSLTVTPSATTDPNGGTNAFTLTPTGTTSSYDNRLYQTREDGTGTYTLSVWARSDVAGAKLTLGLFTYGVAVFNLTSDWVRYSASFTATLANTNVGIYAGESNNSGTVISTNEIEIFGAQLETGSTATAYQKVVDEHDITEAGVTSLEYLSFDGSDDGMATASLDFTGVTVIDMFAGVDVVQGTNRAAIFARYAGDNNNSLGFEAPSTSTNQWGGIIRTGNSVPVFTSAYSPPQKAVLTITHDPASRQLRVDGTQTANQVAPSGGNDIISGVYGVGYRAGTLNDLSFDGKIFGLIVRGASSTTQEITNTEAYLANRSGVTL